MSQVRLVEHAKKITPNRCIKMLSACFLLDRLNQILRYSIALVLFKGIR